MHYQKSTVILSVLGGLSLGLEGCTNDRSDSSESAVGVAELRVSSAAASADGASSHETAHGSSSLAIAPGCAGHDHAEQLESEQLRKIAEQPVAWSKSRRRARDTVHVKILGINDFHGQLSAGRKVSNRAVGGAAVLASYLKASQKGLEDNTIIVHAGDHVGASPPASALLQDEPSIQFLNLLANGDCSLETRFDPNCNLLGTFGNHEFDEGSSELLRLIRGGNHPTGPFLENPWRGARFPYVSANVVNTDTARTLVQPYAIKYVSGVRIGFIGLVLKETPTIVTPTGVAGLSFLDEAESANKYAKKLTQLGVKAIVATIHQGATQRSYVGPTAAFDASTAAGAAAVPTGPIVEIVSKLDPSIDLVVSGHTHQFTNALLKNRAGQDVLVTQAFSYSTAYDDIDLEIERQSGEVVSKVARVVTTWADEGPGLSPDPEVAELVSKSEQWVAPLVERIVGSASTEITGSSAKCGLGQVGSVRKRATTPDCT